MYNILHTETVNVNNEEYNVEFRINSAEPDVGICKEYIEIVNISGLSTITDEAEQDVASYLANIYLD